ncbi:hypothetical protein, partial [Paludibacterium sp.]|uniref:hypothetical protein n=1 Tax=Paludibacterium sp. TaxID=1917523 RepID=UPI0025DF2E2D
MANRPKQRQQIAIERSIPAPVGGLNARDALAQMPETDAPVLDNWFPSPSNVAVRNGYSAWVQQAGFNVKTLMCYSPPSGVRKLFAAANGNIYDVTSAGALPAPSVSGQTSDWWQHLNVQAGGGQYLMCANGADSIQLFNGTTWQTVTGVSAPIAITGITTSNIIHLNNFKGRVFLIEKNSMRAWFLPLNSIGGAASQLDFSMYTKLGGYLMAMITWTVDNAGGIDERAAFITSEGEVLLFTGTDPSYASSWFLQGSFRIGRPVGRRCYARIGSDVAVISADGVYPMSQALLTDRSQRNDALSDKIVNLVNTDVQLYSGNQGWQLILHPIGNKFIVNVPATTGTYQYVQNTVHGAWCRFTGWLASCFELFGDQLMMGTPAGVFW